MGKSVVTLIFQDESCREGYFDLSGVPGYEFIRILRLCCQCVNLSGLSCQLH